VRRYIHNSAALTAGRALSLCGIEGWVSPGFSLDVVTEKS